MITSAKNYIKIKGNQIGILWHVRLGLLEELLETSVCSLKGKVTRECSKAPRPSVCLFMGPVNKEQTF